jgi:hypothetical protein
MSPAARKTLVAAIAVVSLGGVLWMPKRPESEDRAREREVREFVLGLERDLLRNKIELFTHVIANEDPTRSERADAVRHSLSELIKLNRPRFVDVQLSVTGEKALVQLTVSGYAPDSSGHLNPHTQPVLLRLEKHAVGWKIVDIYPRVETH